MKWLLFYIFPILLIAYVLQYYVLDTCEMQMILYDTSRQATIILLCLYAYHNSKNIRNNLMALGLIVFSSFEFICELRGGVIRGDISEVIWIILLVLGIGWAFIIRNKT